MRRTIVLGSIVLMAVTAAGSAEYFYFKSRLNTSLGVMDPSSVELKPAPIPAEWVLEGKPDTRSAVLARTADESTKFVVWATTASRFEWHYESDEIVHVLDGEVFLSENGKPERRVGAGEFVFFPEGAKVVWRVPHHIRKVATFKHPLPGPMASLIRWLRSAKRLVVGTATAAPDPML